MVRWLRIILIAAGVGVGLLMLVLVGGFSYLKTPQAQRGVQKQVNRILPGSVTWRRMDFSVFEGRLDIDEVLVEGPERERLAGLDRFHLDISWLALLKGRITVEEARIENPWVDLVVAENGRLNLMRAFPEAAPQEPAPDEASGGLPFDVAVDVFSLTGGAVSYRDPKAALVVSLEGISAGVEALVLSAPAGQVTLSIGRGSIESPAFNGPVDQFQIRANLDADRLSPAELHLAAGNTNIRLTGSVDRLGADPLLDATLDADIALAEIRDILQLAPELTGNAVLHISAKGSLANPEATAKLDYGGGILGGFPVDRVGLALHLADQRIKIDPLSVESYLGMLDADGEIDLKDAFPSGFFSSDRTLGALGYRLAVRHKGLLLEKALARDAGYGGALDADISLEGKGISLDDISARCRAALTGTGIVAPGMDRPVDVAAEAHGGLEGAEATVDQLTIDAGDASLSGSGRYHLAGGELKADLSLAAPDLATVLALAGIEGVHGEVFVDAAVNGTLTQPLATINASGKQLALPDVTLGDLRLEMGLDDTGSVEIKTLVLENQGSRATARGRIDLLETEPEKGLTVRSDLPVDLTVSLDNVAPADFLKKKDIQGRVDGTLTARGPVRSPEVRAEIAGKGLAVGPDTIGDVGIRLAFAGGEFSIDQLAVHNRRSDLAVAGTVTLMDRDMTMLDDPAFDLVIKKGHLFAGDFLAEGDGELVVSGSFSGRRRNPGGELTLAGRGLAIGGNRVGNVDAGIRMSDGRILLSPVTVENGKSKVSLSGTVGVMTPGTGAFLEDPELDLQVSEGQVYLEDFIDGMTGTLTLNGDIKGSVSRPRGTVGVDGETLNLGGQAFDRVSLAARMDGRNITIERFQVAVVPEETLDGSGSVDLDRSAYDIRLSSKGISLASINALGGRDLVSGKVALDISGKGTFDDPKAEGQVSVTGLQVNRKTMEDILIRLDLKDRKARVWGRPGFEMDARYHLDRKEFSATLGFDRTELAPYFKLAGLDDLDGKIDGTIKADGRSDALERVRVVVDLKGLTLLSEGKEFLSSPRIQASLDNNAYSLADTEIRLLKDGRVTLRGKGNLGGNVAMSLDGIIPFAVVEPFFEEGVDAGGTLRLDAGLGGTLEHPEIRGNVTLDNIGMIVPELEQRIDDLTGRIVISPEVLVIEKVAGRLDSGSFELDGRIELKDLKPSIMSVKLTARKLPIEIPDTLSLLLDSRLKLTGTAERSLLKGDIKLLEGRYTRDVDLRLLEGIRRGITERTREVSPVSPKPPPSPLLVNMALDVSILRRAHFEVENNLADMSLSPDLRIIGTAARPVVSGRASVDEGVITYQSKEFEIRRGVVDFLNPYRTEPTLDIEGEVEVRDWIIYLKVSGTPDDLRFRLTSDPAEEHGDIISLLLFGSTLTEMRQSGGDLGASAERVLRNMLAERVASGVRGATGLDIFEMEFTEARDDPAADDIRVTMGRELSRRITLKYGIETNRGELVHTITSEYKLLEDLIVSIFQDTQGNFGGALSFRMEFR